MNPSRTNAVFTRELRLSPRSPVVLMAIGVPLLLTFLISAVFGSLFDTAPSVGIVDEGTSALTVEAQALDGIDVSVIDSEDELRAMVEAHDLDSGLVLGEEFDDDVAAGRSPDLTFLVSGDSLAANRAIVAITTMDLVRGISNEEPPVTVVVTPVGDEDYVPIGDRLVPMLVLYAVLIAALFVPAASLVDEREKRTIDAVLVTPTRLGEVLVGKAAFAVLLAVLMGLLTLALNRAFAGQFIALTLVIVVGSVMMVLIGLFLGLWSKDINTLYTAVKAGGILIFLPALFYVFPGLPSWIPQLFPTFYFLDPVFEISIGGASLGDVWVDLAIAVAICVALVPIVRWQAKRTEHQLAILV